MRNAMKKLLMTSFLLLAACAPEPQRESTDRAESRVGRPGAPVTMDEILEPRDGVAADPQSYTATEGPYRLFGIEGRSALIADALSWSTRPYAQGDLVGRGLRVARIDGDQVTLHGAHHDVVLRPGADVELRVIRHRLDVVARPLGRHRYAVDAAAARVLRDSALPSVESVEVFGAPMLKLGAIAPGSILAEADFHEGDLVAALDDVPANDGTLRAIANALSDRDAFSVRIYRNGVVAELSYARR
jgi:hypothetical protein